MTKQDKNGKTSEDKKIMELAIATRNWMRQVNAYIDEETEKHGYITVPEWCEVFDRSAHEWSQVKREMIRLGHTLTYDNYNGHYLGKPGSQAQNVLQLLYRAVTMMNTAALLMEYMMGNPDWQMVREAIEEGLSTRDMSMQEASKIIASIVGPDGKDKIEKMFLDDGVIYA